MKTAAFTLNPGLADAGDGLEVDGYFGLALEKDVFYGTFDNDFDTAILKLVTASKPERFPLTVEIFSTVN